MKREIEEKGRPIDTHTLKNVHLGIDVEDTTIQQIFKEHNGKVEGLINKDFASGTVERYKTCYKHLHDFIKAKYKRTDVSLKDVCPMFVTD